MKDNESDKEDLNFSAQQDYLRGITLHQHTDKIELDLQQKRLAKARQKRQKSKEYHSTLSSFINKDLDYIPLVDPEQYLFYQQEGIAHSVIKQLQGGKIEWQASLDLHGLYFEAAKKTLARFLRSAQQEYWCCVLIVHGKSRQASASQPTLKGFINAILPQWPHTAAFCSALPKHGGTGAIYLLLKSQ